MGVSGVMWPVTGSNDPDEVLKGKLKWIMPELCSKASRFRSR